MKTVNIGLLVGIAALAMIGVSALALSGVFTGASKYTTFADAKKTGDEVHVVGAWVDRDNYQYDSQRDLLQFFMQDSTNNTTLVHYYDPMPVNFKTAEKIVVQGKYEQDAFVADRIFMKCPSKYNEGELVTTEAAATR